MSYKLTLQDAVIRLSDNALIPFAAGNSDYAEYQKWLANNNVPLPVDPPSPEQIITSLTAAVQQHLDDTARTRGYDGILSACTYATDTHLPFQAEGQACVTWRGSVWTACYAIMAQVQAGTHPMPTAASLIAELPAMVWP